MLLLVWSLVPLAMTLWFSFRRYNLLNPMIHGFAGFNNYQFLLRDPALLAALWVTVVLVGAVLVITDLPRRRARRPVRDAAFPAAASPAC